MGTSAGAVKFNDKIMYCGYDNTGDWFYNSLFDEPADLWNYEDDKECLCGHDEEVELFADYVGGMNWKGRACRYCRAITDGQEGNAEWYGYPEWLGGVEKRGGNWLHYFETPSGFQYGGANSYQAFKSKKGEIRAGN